MTEEGESRFGVDALIAGQGQRYGGTTYVGKTRNFTASTKSLPGRSQSGGPNRSIDPYILASECCERWTGGKIIDPGVTDRLEWYDSWEDGLFKLVLFVIDFDRESSGADDKNSYS